MCEKEILLETSHLSVDYPVKKTSIFEKQRYLQAVTDVSIQIYKGETFGLVGESGCGKSTFANATLGLQKPTTGKLLFEGEDFEEKSVRRRTLSGGETMIPVKVLAVRYLAGADPALCRGLRVPEHCTSLAMVTTDCDDATYIALDEATKAAEVEVAYSHSFYAGAANASTPNAGEVIGILAARTPGAVRSGMEAALAALDRLGFEEYNGVPYLAHTVTSVGSFLAKEAGVQPGSALAYLIAPPLEGMYAMDAAMKAADVRLCKLYTPPSETNFGGGLLTGTQSACDAACAAFSEAVREVAARPVQQ